MILADLLTPCQVIAELQATERWQAITELVDCLIRCGKLEAIHRDVVLASLRQREETMSTGIGFGIAIPHASCDQIPEVIAAFGRSTSGIEFDSLDNAPARFIVLFLVPQNQFQTHLRTLAAIAKLLNDSAMRDALDEAPDAEAILETIRARKPVGP